MKKKWKIGRFRIRKKRDEFVIRRVNWSPCGNYLSSASFDGTVAIWDRKSGQFECSATLEGHENEVKSASWSNSGNFIASCSRQGDNPPWSQAFAIHEFLFGFKSKSSFFVKKKSEFNKQVEGNDSNL